MMTEDLVWGNVIRDWHDTVFNVIPLLVVDYRLQNI